MNPKWLDGPDNFARSRVSRSKHFPSPSSYALFLLLIIGFCIGPALRAQQSEGQTTPVTSVNSIPKTPAEQLSALELERTNAWNRVLRIVNQPVHAFVRNPNYHVMIYSPGWFHPGAIKPNFNTVDVRKSQELIYASHQYVTSDLNPGVMFQGNELEFNAMTKFFYANRSLPKHKLSEAEMLEINRLYRIIGHCNSEIERLQNPVATETTASGQVEKDNQPDDAPRQAFDGIRHIPRQTRLLYGGIAIGVLIFLVLISRVFRNKTD